MLITNKTSVKNDEARKAEMMEWADRKEERKERERETERQRHGEHSQPLAMNLDKERRPTRE